jgi:hypothetical protein
MFNVYGGNFTQLYEKVIVTTCPPMSIQPNIRGDGFIHHIHLSNQTSGGMNSSLTLGMIPSHPFLTLK